MENNKEILEKIKSDGYCITKNVFTLEEIQAIRTEMLELYSEVPHGAEYIDRRIVEQNAYPYGKHLRINNFSLHS
jgi:hypothetical protein